LALHDTTKGFLFFPSRLFRAFPADRRRLFPFLFRFFFFFFVGLLLLAKNNASFGSEAGRARGIHHTLVPYRSQARNERIPFFVFKPGTFYIVGCDLVCVCDVIELWMGAVLSLNVGGGYGIRGWRVSQLDDRDWGTDGMWHYLQREQH
jgi:hypothetical protein